MSVTFCQEAWPQPGADVWRTCYTFFVLLTTYLLPLGATAPAYAAVARRLWQRRAPGNADTARDLNQLQSKRRVRTCTSTACCTQSVLQATMHVERCHCNHVEYLMNKQPYWPLIGRHGFVYRTIDKYFSKKHIPTYGLCWRPKLGHSWGYPPK